VLVITKREFDNFGAAQDAYGQTVRALDRLVGSDRGRAKPEPV